MDERRTAEGVEHLQAAARELLGAARAFLDVVEDVVEDSDRLNGAAATVADLVRSFGGNRPQPWERAAWEQGGPAEQDRSDPVVSSWWDEPYEDESAEDESDEGGGSSEEPAAATAPARKAPAKKAPAKKAAKKAPAKKATAGKPAAEKPAAEKPAAEKPAAADDPAPKRTSSRVRRIAVD